MSTSYLSWRASPGGVCIPVAQPNGAPGRPIAHGQRLSVEMGGGRVTGCVDLTSSVSGGALSIIMPTPSKSRRGIAPWITVSVLPGTAIELEEVQT